MMSTRTILVSFIAVVMLFSGIVPAFAGVVGYQGKIGVIAPLTGDMAQNGLTAKVAMEMAQQDFQLVHPDTVLDVAIEDSESNSERAAELIREFNKQGIRIVIATGSSEEILAIKPFADANGMIVIAPTSTAPSLALVDSIIRLSPNDLYHAKAMADYLRFRGIEVVAPIYRNDVFGKDFFTEFKARFEENGGSVTEGVKYDTATSDFSSYTTELAAQVQSARQIQAASPVAVLAISFGEIHSIFTAASSQPALASVGWYGTEDYAQDERIDNDPIARSFALSVQFTSSIYSPQALIHPYTSIVPYYENLTTRARKVNSAELLPSLAVMYDSLWLAGYMIRDSRLINVETFLDNRPAFLGYSLTFSLDENGDRKKGFYSYYRYMEVENKPIWALVGSYWPTRILSRDPIAYREFIPDANDKQIRIGLLFSLTGAYSESEKSFLRMAEIAEEDINALLQRRYSPNSKIEYVIADVESNPDVALAKLQEMKRQGIQLVVGPVTSEELEKVKDFANQNDMILISPCSTAVSLAKDDNLFRFTLDDSKQAAALAALMIQKGYRNVETLYRNDTYGSEFLTLFKGAFTAVGGHCGDGIPYDPHTGQFDGILKTLENQVMDSLQNYSASETAVLLISFDEGVTVLETLASSPSLLADLHWFGGDGIAANASLLESSPAVEMAIRTNFTTSISGLKMNYEVPFVLTFLDAATQRIGYAPTAFDIAVYDAIWLFTLLAENQDWQWDSPFSELRSAFITLANYSFCYRSLNGLNEYGDSLYGSIDFYRIDSSSESKAWDVFATYMFYSKEKLVFFNDNGESSASEWSLYR